MKTELDYDRLKKCADCGACYDVCPSCLHLSGYDPRAVIRGILEGRADDFIDQKQIWQCLECHQCLELCFQHYGFEDAMTAMRLYATKKGVHPPQIKRGWDMFAKTGRLGDPVLPARKKLGLPEPVESGKEEFLKVFDSFKKSRAKKQSDKVQEAGE